MITTLLYSANKTTKSDGNWNSNSTWNGGVPGTGDNITINHIVTVTTNTTTVRNIIINNILKNNGFRIRLTGNWTNNGNYIDTLGRVIFSGNTQTINGNTNFYNLRIRPSNKVTLNDTILVKNFLTLSTNLDVTNGLFIIYADSTYSGRIDAVGNGANIIGNFIFQKWLDRCNGWSLYGGPFDATLNNYADSATDQMIYTGFPNSDYPTFGWTPNAYLWDENWNTVDQGWITPDGNNVIPRGKGFWYWNSDTVFNTLNPLITQKWKVVTKGSIDFTSTFNFQIQYTNTGDITSDGWNLVSNPYPGTIDWISFTRTNVDNAIYVFNTCSQSYMSYIGGVSTNGGSRYISPFQGFYIKSNNVSPILSCDRSSIVNNYSPLAKTTNNFEANNILRIYLNDDEIVIRENDDADSTFNSNFDAYKFMDNAQIYSKNYNDTSIYSINTINSYTKKIPIYVKGKGTGSQTDSITLNFSGLETWESKYELYLEDLNDSSMTNLKNIQFYSFVEPVNYNLTNRFIIHMFINGTINPDYFSVMKKKQDNKKEKTLINIVNIMGQDIDIKTYKGIVIYRYSDGSSEKKLNVINL